MEPVKKMSAKFHRLRRAHFAKKNASAKSIHEIVPEIPNAQSIHEIDSPNAQSTLEVEWEPKKGRKPKAFKKYPRQTPEEWQAAERKRIFMGHIQLLARRKRQ